MSVFPAAITLEEHSFDYGYLLAQPGYSDGGPNVHSLAPITLVTALTIRIIGDGPNLFPVLHIYPFRHRGVCLHRRLPTERSWRSEGGLQSP